MAGISKQNHVMNTLWVRATLKSTMSRFIKPYCSKILTTNFLFDPFYP